MSSELLTLVGGMAGNVVSAVGLVLMNKRVVVKDGFRFMTILTGFHFYFAFIACFLMLMTGHLQYKTVHNYYSVARIALGMLSSVLFMNFNLAANSVGFYQVSKLMCIPVSLLVETLLDKRQQELSVTLVFSLFLILLGVGLVCVKEVSFNSLGMLWAVLGVLSTSFAQVFFSPLQRDLGLNPLQLLFHVSPWLTFGSFLMTPLFDDIKALLDMPIGVNLCVDVFLSCCLAIFLNTTNYFVLSATSPLTYQVLGHGKTICIFILGILLYDDKPSKKAIAGIVMAFLGVVVYTEENRQQGLRRSRQRQYGSTTSSIAGSTSKGGEQQLQKMEMGAHSPSKYSSKVRS